MFDWKVDTVLCTDPMISVGFENVCPFLSLCDPRESYTDFTIVEELAPVSIQNLTGLLLMEALTTHFSFDIKLFCALYM